VDYGENTGGGFLGGTASALRNLFQMRQEQERVALEKAQAEKLADPNSPFNQLLKARAAEEQAMAGQKTTMTIGELAAAAGYKLPVGANPDTVVPTTYLAPMIEKLQALGSAQNIAGGKNKTALQIEQEKAAAALAAAKTHPGANTNITLAGQGGGAAGVGGAAGGAGAGASAGAVDMFGGLDTNERKTMSQIYSMAQQLNETARAYHENKLSNLGSGGMNFLNGILPGTVSGPVMGRLDPAVSDYAQRNELLTDQLVPLVTGNPRAAESVRAAIRKNSVVEPGTPDPVADQKFAQIYRDAKDRLQAQGKLTQPMANMLDEISQAQGTPAMDQVMAKYHGLTALNPGEATAASVNTASTAPAAPAGKAAPQASINLTPGAAGAAAANGAAAPANAGAAAQANGLAPAVNPGSTGAAAGAAARKSLGDIFGEAPKQ
jgi:hypothetical protein